MNKEVIAAFRAATAKPDYLTVEKLEAGLGGWGAFNMGVWAACDVIAREIRKGRSLKLETTNEPHSDTDEVAKKAVNKLQELGADPANAALITAVLLYWAGSNVQCGMPCPNRKLGAVTRMAAGIPSGRVSSIPTEKQNNKISGFAATLAIYQAMQDENLAPYDSTLLPLGAGGPIIGHSAIGEDHLFPKLGMKLATIGTRAMVNAYLSVGMRPNKWLAALLGTAAALEIIHPDAYVGEDFGRYLETRTPETSAEAAVKEAGLPEVLTLRGTGEEVPTARLVGDIAIILKDSGTPTVVGMIMFSEVCNIIAQGGVIGAGRAGGPLVIPLHHWVTAPVTALRMVGLGKSDDEIIAAIKDMVSKYYMSDDAAVSTNILARKAGSLNPGPISEAIFRATEPTLTNAIYKRAERAAKELEAGATLTKVIGDIQERRIEEISGKVAKTVGKRLGVDIEYIRLSNVCPGSGRRGHKCATRHFAFDAHVDAEVKINGKVYELKNVLAKAAPEALMSGDKETLDAVSAVAMAVIELLCAGACSMDVVVPACVAAARGMEPDEALKEALKSANVIIAIPPSTGIKEAVRLAAEISKGIED